MILPMELSEKKRGILSQNSNKGNFKNKGKRRPAWRSGGNKKRTTAQFTCPVCGEGVKELTSAIEYNGQGPTHFDCVLRDIGKQENIKENQKVVYLGSGNFGVIENKKNEAGVPFTLIKSIEVEDREKEFEWRLNRKIDIQIAKKENKAKS